MRSQKSLQNGAIRFYMIWFTNQSPENALFTHEVKHSRSDSHSLQFKDLLLFHHHLVQPAMHLNCTVHASLSITN